MKIQAEGEIETLIKQYHEEVIKVINTEGFKNFEPITQILFKLNGLMSSRDLRLATIGISSILQDHMDKTLGGETWSRITS